MSKLKPHNSPPKNFVKKPLGEILIEAGLVSIHQIEIALREQKQYDLKIGEIIASHGWIKQETADFFAEKWHVFLQQKQRRPLALYLFAAGLINREQLLFLKLKQKESQHRVRLHAIAVAEGYIKQETVDFFLHYLFKSHSPALLSYKKPYEIIKEYINGESNFQKKELSEIKLNGVTLKQVIFDGSNLRQANLTNSNLSHSSLIEVDFHLANLEFINLSHAILKQSCLIEANLHKSNLEATDFQGANLQEANLQEANLLNASFVGADLRGTKLANAYSYDVYYSQNTTFDASFDPIQAGWKLKK